MSNPCQQFKDLNVLFLPFSSSSSGAVKITPAHDHNDYETGKRNNLPFITMMDESGLISDVGDYKDEYKKFIVCGLSFFPIPTGVHERSLVKLYFYVVPWTLQDFPKIAVHK